jgi:uncharacterized membrane protein SirB2
MLRHAPATRQSGVRGAGVECHFPDDVDPCADMASTYALLKLTHVIAVLVTYVLFVLRGVWMMQGSPRLTARWVRIVPHVNDTILLASAIALAVILGQAPGNAGWLTAKVVGLVLYVVLGTVAIKRGRTRGVRIAAWIAAQLVLFYIVAVAVTKTPWPFAGAA